MRVMYFCYERSHVDRHWEPVVYYDEKPIKSSQSKESNVERTDPVLVPEEFIHRLNGDDEPMFGRLCEQFPAPIAPKEEKYVIASRVPVS